MLRICICDDEPSARAAVRGLSEKLLASLGIEAVFFEFASAEALLTAYPEQADILFLDVQMGALSGMEAARLIRRQDGAATIVFMSNYAQYAVEGYGVRAYRYLLKPLSERMFQDEIRSVFVERAHSLGRALTIREEGGIHVLRAEELLCIDTAGNKLLRFHTQKRDYLSRGALSGWEDRLRPLHFARIHSACLVNLAFIRQIGEDNQVLLSDGTRLPLSRHRRRDFLETFMEYAGGRL